MLASVLHSFRLISDTDGWRKCYVRKMPRWLEIPFCIIAFAVPSAIALLMVWPIMMRRAVPDELNRDTATILVIAVLLGGLITLLVSRANQHRVRA